MATVASATLNPNKVVTREKGIRGDAGANGEDGQGFNLVRESKLANPIVKILSPNYPAEVGFDNLTWTRASAGRGFNKYGQLASADQDIPRESEQGWILEGAGENLLLNSDDLSTQSATVTSDPHTLSFFGSGSVTLSGAHTATLSGTGENDRVSLSFTPTAGSLTLTVSGDVNYAQLEQEQFSTSYITSEGTKGTRAPDIVTMPAFYNTPFLLEDFSIYFKVYFDGFTSSDDFIFSLPNGEDDDDLTVCGFCNDGSLTLRISDGTTSADCTTSILSNTQYDVCLVKQENLITLYINGSSVDDQAHSLIVPTGTNGIVKIGGNESGTTKNMFGKIYNFRIYDFALNESESKLMAGV